MKVKQTKEQRMTKIYKKSKNKDLLDSFVQKYMTQTKSSLENLLNMCEILRELDDSVKNYVLDENDLNYFCDSVGLKKSSSTYRKYVCIGKKVDLLRQYIKNIPSSVSTIYEICTLESDKFERLVNSSVITHKTTLHELKHLSGKQSTQTQSKSSNDDFLKIEFQYETLSIESKNELLKLLTKIKSNTEFNIVCPISSKLLNVSNNVIDIKLTETEGMYEYE